MAFKATRMRGSIMEGQDKFIMRKPDNADIGLREDCEDDLVDVGCDADLYFYVANQESTDSIREAQVGDALFAFNGSSQDVFHFCSLSLD